MAGETFFVSALRGQTLHRAQVRPWRVVEKLCLFKVRQAVALLAVVHLLKRNGSRLLGRVTSESLEVVLLEDAQVAQRVDTLMAQDPGELLDDGLSGGFLIQLTLGLANGL